MNQLLFYFSPITRFISLVVKKKEELVLALHLLLICRIYIPLSGIFI